MSIKLIGNVIVVVVVVLMMDVNECEVEWVVLDQLLEVMMVVRDDDEANVASI
jgi:hypothetical protein